MVAMAAKTADKTESKGQEKGLVRERQQSMGVMSFYCAWSPA